jgi:uncharacterized protein YbjT (DUF2867 family)
VKIAIVGGTGDLGSRLVAELAARRHEVRALSRSQGPEIPAGSSHRRVDLTTGDGLAEAIEGMDVVIDASNSRREAQAVLVEGTRRLLDAEAEAGVGHHVGVSIVGCDRVPMAYYKAKVAQERAIAAGPVPWSLLRATQFHSLLDRAFSGAARLRVLPTGSAPLQPVDAGIVARRLADVAQESPAGRLPDIAGPEVLTLTELARIWRGARGRRLLALPIPMVGKIGHAMRDGGLCEPDAAAAESRTFERWLEHA